MPKFSELLKQDDGQIQSIYGTTQLNWGDEYIGAKPTHPLVCYAWMLEPAVEQYHIRTGKLDALEEKKAVRAKMRDAVDDRLKVLGLDRHLQFYHLGQRALVYRIGRERTDEEIQVGELGYILKVLPYDDYESLQRKCTTVQPIYEEVIEVQHGKEVQKAALCVFPELTNRGVSQAQVNVLQRACEQLGDKFNDAQLRNIRVFPNDPSPFTPTPMGIDADSILVGVGKPKCSEEALEVEGRRWRYTETRSSGRQDSWTLQEYCCPLSRIKRKWGQNTALMTLVEREDRDVAVRQGSAAKYVTAEAEALPVFQDEYAVLAHFFRNIDIFNKTASKLDSRHYPGDEQDFQIAIDAIRLVIKHRRPLDRTLAKDEFGEENAADYLDQYQRSLAGMIQKSGEILYLLQSELRPIENAFSHDEIKDSPMEGYIKSLRQKINLCKKNLFAFEALGPEGVNTLFPGLQFHYFKAPVVGLDDHESGHPIDIFRELIRNGELDRNGLLALAGREANRHLVDDIQQLLYELQSGTLSVGDVENLGR